MEFIIYKDKNLQWRWRLVASNGRIVADSAEGYQNRGDCLYQIANMRKLVGEAEVVYGK